MSTWRDRWSFARAGSTVLWNSAAIQQSHGVTTHGAVGLCTVRCQITTPGRGPDWALRSQRERWPFLNGALFLNKEV